MLRLPLYLLFAWRALASDESARGSTAAPPVVLPTAVKVGVTMELGLYRASEAEDGSAPLTPAGVYVQSGKVHGSPTYAREGGVDGPAPPSHLYRSSRGIWVITNSTANFEKNRGSFITKSSDVSPLGLTWRFHSVGKWPVDETMAVTDYSVAYEEAELRKGPPRLITRYCAGGVGDSAAPGYAYTDTPASFECWSNSPYCSNDDAVYCAFSAEDVDAVVDAYDEELQEVSAAKVILEDELELLDGRGQTADLKQRVQEELEVASFRVYLMAPWLGMKTYVQTADAILLFSVCASYGVAAGIFFSAAKNKKEA